MLNYRPIQTNRYNDFNALRHDVEIEEDFTNYTHVPIAMYFENDQTINNKFTFNEYGIKALCSATGINGLFQSMNAVEEPLMASEFLNKLFTQDNIRKELASKRFVTIEDEIVGVVGSRYLPYSNRQFLDDLFADNKNETLTLSRASTSNTKMVASFVEEHKGFQMKDGEDFTKIGISVKNSGVGNEKVRSTIWTLRPQCLNGMVHLIDKGITSAKHTGIEEAMKNKLDSMITLAKDQYEVIKERVKLLTQIPYANDTAKTFLQLEAPVDIIPQLRKEKLYSPKKKHVDVKAHNEDLNRSIKILDEVPQTYGGIHTDAVWNSVYRDKNSMYDYVESFTEYAQTCDAQTQEEIEEDAGKLTSWISNNKLHLGYHDPNIDIPF